MYDILECANVAVSTACLNNGLGFDSYSDSASLHCVPNVCVESEDDSSAKGRARAVCRRTGIFGAACAPSNGEIDLRPRWPQRPLGTW